MVCAAGFCFQTVCIVCLDLCAFSYYVSLCREHHARICNRGVTTPKFGETSDTFIILVTASICCKAMKEMGEKPSSRHCCGP